MSSSPLASRMFWPVFRAELGAGLTRPLVYLCAAVFFFLAFQTIAITSPTASGLIRDGHTWHNAPYTIAHLIAVMSVLATFVATVLIAPAVHRDVQHRTHAFFLTAPMTRLDYLLGRFAGAFGATLLVFVGATAGVLVAALSIPADLNGPYRLSAFVEPLLVFAVPNLLFVGALVFAVATLSRSMLTAYVSAVVLMMLFGIAQGMLEEVLQKGMVTGAPRTVLALAEPFGGGVLEIVTGTWSLAEKNTRPIPLSGLLLAHRVLWIAMALGLLALTWRRFQALEQVGRVGQAERLDQVEHVARVSAIPPGTLPRVGTTHTGRQYRRLYVVLTCRELGLTVRHLAFLVLAGATLATLHSNFVGNVEARGIYPRTGFFVTQGLRESFNVIVLTIFFAGVLVWRERDQRSHELIDSQPLPNGVIYGSKLSALLLMQTTYATLLVAFGVFAQVVVFGYTRIELGVYAQAVFGVALLGWWTIAVVAFLCQVLAPNVYAGYVLSAIVIGGASIVPALGVADGLWRPGFTPAYTYSDMNGFGHFAAPLAWYRIYWLFGSLCLAIVSALLWPRGGREHLAARVRTLRRRATRPARRMLAAAVAGSIATGAVIAYNTGVLSSGTRPDRVEAVRAAYERAWREFEALPQPSVEAVRLSADFFPRVRRLALRGTMTLRNRTAAPIRDLHVTLLPTWLLEPARLEVDAPTARTMRDAEKGYSIFTLAAPMSPGATVTLRFAHTVGVRGFSDEGRNGHLVRNGSVVLGSDAEYFPRLGYRAELELTDAEARARHGLPRTNGRAPFLDDEAAQDRRAANWIAFDATVSTDADQQPVANGRQVRTWLADSRRFATFTTDGVINNNIVLASGAYASAREQVGPVEVEILHHPDHADNLRSMFAGVRCGLEYGARHFAPYAQRTVRIVEVPMYTMLGNARAVPTLFLWGELGGFIRDLRREPGFDRVFSTAVHETAHQWWGGRVRVLNEALSDYVRLACLEESFGRERTADFVRETRRAYFRGRGEPGGPAVNGRGPEGREGEQTLREGGQHESAYTLMWRLRRMLGEPVVNAALRDVVATFADRPDRYPTPDDVARALRAHAPAQRHPVIADVFDHITLHPIRAREARASRLADGRYRVTLAADLRKSYADARGAETLAPLDGYVDYVEVGVYGPGDTLLSLTTHRITDPRADLSLVVDAPPTAVVLDPQATLLDPDQDDNRAVVKPAP